MGWLEVAYTIPSMERFYLDFRFVVIWGFDLEVDLLPFHTVRGFHFLGDAKHSWQGLNKSFLSETIKDKKVCVWKHHFTMGCYCRA